MRMRCCPVLTFCFVLCALAPQSARGESWFRANPEVVRQYSQELADRSRPVSERLEALRDLRILFTTFGADNSEPAIRVLRTVRNEPGELARKAAVLLNDLQTALKRRDKRMRATPIDPSLRNPSTIGVVR
jgi:hypothetical protein